MKKYLLIVIGIVGVGGLFFVHCSFAAIGDMTTIPAPAPILAASPSTGRTWGDQLQQQQRDQGLASGRHDDVFRHRRQPHRHRLRRDEHVGDRSSSSSVTKVSPAGAMTTYSGTGANPYGIAFDGTNMWTENHGANSVTKVSPTGDMTTYSGTGVPPTVSPSTGRTCG